MCVARDRRIIRSEAQPAQDRTRYPRSRKDRKFYRAGRAKHGWKERGTLAAMTGAGAGSIVLLPVEWACAPFGCDILTDDLYYSYRHNEILRESNGPMKCRYLGAPS